MGKYFGRDEGVWWSGPEQTWGNRVIHTSIHSTFADLGVKSGVRKQTDEYYVFRVFLGSIFGQMRMGGGLGGFGPWKPEIFTPQFTKIGLFLAAFELFWSLFEPFQALWPRQRHGMRSWSTGLHSGDVWASSGYPN